MSLKVSQIVNNLVDVKDIRYDRQYSRVAKLHKYWSRKPWFVIDQYIEKYSKKNDLILDPFCGSGIIGLQSILANRNFIGYDLNPFAVFLANNSLNINYSQATFKKDLSTLESEVSKKIMALYKIKKKYILYTILGKNNGKNYNAVLADDNFLNKINVILPKKNLEPIFKFPKNLKFPDMNFPTKFYKDRFSYKGVRKVSDMFSRRNLLALATLYNSINKLPLKNKKLLMLAFTNTLLHVSKLKSESVRPLSVNNFWIPDDFIEENVWWRFIERVKNIMMAKEVIAKKAFQNGISNTASKIYNKSSLKMTEIKSSSIDYLITDPPYGDTIQYSELSYVWNCWLGNEFDTKDEVIINPVQKKGMKEYYMQLVSFIGEVKRVLKKDAHFTLAYHNKDLKLWISLAKLIRDHGMRLVDISSYNTFGSPFNKHWSKFSPKSDFYVTFRNSKKGTNNHYQRKVSPSQIAKEIYKFFGDGKTFNLNKAYDLFVGVVISKIFNGYQLVDSEKLNIKNITSLFQDIIETNNA